MFWIDLSYVVVGRSFDLNTFRSLGMNNKNNLHINNNVAMRFQPTSITDRNAISFMWMSTVDSKFYYEFWIRWNFFHAKMNQQFYQGNVVPPIRRNHFLHCPSRYLRNKRCKTTNDLFFSRGETHTEKGSEIHNAVVNFVIKFEN